MIKRFFGWFSCRVLGAHEWTCDAKEGIKPTKEHLEGGFEGFLEYATMYCKRCGEASELSKRRMDGPWTW